MVNRRTALRGAAVGGVGVAALSVVGCGSDKDDSGSSQNTSTPAVDWTKGVPGGSLNIQQNNYPANLNLIESTGGNGRLAGLVYSSLLTYKAGKSGVDPTSLESEPDVAAAMPEQPNDLTYIFKLKPGVKFQNGRVMTAEDVKYSLDKYFQYDKSVWVTQYNWLDK